MFKTWHNEIYENCPELFQILLLSFKPQFSVLTKETFKWSDVKSLHEKKKSLCCIITRSDHQSALKL